MDHAELTTEQVLKRDIPWETYMTTRLISGTDLQLLRRYDNRSEIYRAQLLDDDGPAYVRVFVSILRDIFKEETVEYVLALIDEMLTANPKRARLFHDKSLANEDPYEPFLRLLWKGNWFIQEKSCKTLASVVSARPKAHDGVLSNGEASNSKRKVTSIDDVLKGLVEWLCAQLKKLSHPSRAIPIAVNCLATLLKEPVVRSSFVQADGVKLLVPLISPASTQQSIQLLYETCLCVWLLSYYEPAIEYLATSRALPRLIEVVKTSTKEKVSSSCFHIAHLHVCVLGCSHVLCWPSSMTCNALNLSLSLSVVGGMREYANNSTNDPKLRKLEYFWQPNPHYCSNSLYMVLHK
uniref:V-type proton ATPase subunit H n=1 Tax=Rhizophora mucronata TaxID=61149 RepID=A0A2P2KX45_RHIMU